MTIIEFMQNGIIKPLLHKVSKISVLPPSPIVGKGVSAMPIKINIYIK